MRRFAGILYALLAAALPAPAAQLESPVAIPSRAIGYTQHATALPGGQAAMHGHWQPENVPPGLDLSAPSGP